MNEGRQLKSRLSAGQICLGTWVSTSDPTIVELLAGSGFDFIIIDTEHGPLDIDAVQLGAMAVKGTDVTLMVRVAWNDAVLIKRVLDVGAGGVVVPLVRTAQDVRDAIAACKYPPAGIRGHGPRRPSCYWRCLPGYIASANDDIVIWAQIEHIDAVKNIRDIASVRGLTGVLVGPSDLSGSMGMLGQTSHPDVLAAIRTVIAGSREANTPAGIVTSAVPEAAVGWIEQGMQFATLDSADGFLVSGSQAAVTGVRGLLDGAKQGRR